MVIEDFCCRMGLQTANPEFDRYIADIGLHEPSQHLHLRKRRGCGHRQGGDFLFDLGRSIAPASVEEMYRYVAAQEMIERRELLLRRLRERGAMTLEVLPGQLATGLVNQYLEVKERSLL